MISVRAWTSRRVGARSASISRRRSTCSRVCSASAVNTGTVRAPRRTAIEQPAATRSPSGSSRSSANRRNTDSGSCRPSPAASRRTCGRMTGAHAGTVEVIAPIGCSPAISTSRTLSIHDASASSRATSASLERWRRCHPAGTQTAPSADDHAGHHPTRRRHDERTGDDRPDQRRRPSRARDAASACDTGDRRAACSR